MKSKIFSIWFTLILVSMMIITIVHQPVRFSPDENRYLAKKPDIKADEVFSGSFDEQVETYLSDQFAFRDTSISLKTQFQKLIGMTDNGRVYFGKDKYYIDKLGYVDPHLLDGTIASINKLAKNHPGMVKTMIVPSTAEIDTDKLPANVEDVRKKAMEQLEQGLDNDVTQVKLADLFMKKRSKTQLYYRNDHHWTSDAAFIAYQQWAKTNGVKALSKKEFKVATVSSDFIGATYSKAIPFDFRYDKIKSYQSKTKVSVSYSNGLVTDSLFNNKALTGKDKYVYFMNGNDSLVKINTSVKNGKNLLLLKDSYANCFMPFLVNHYENIYVIDPRYYSSIDDVMKNDAITDVLILYNIDSLMQDEYLSAFLDTLPS